ncbi:haloacid dehalogenase type 2 [Grosmannia clavigera kw1407]|uniref:Haloacid dehalogenase type 2 n=1 Tax=Grosmannia clavigera (strain kw1407 / UAMH 11150) TaxID=655863 RepID=F0XR03_GROCL|nr:haloacid dehalogenase type 2 [Grosmannia clavigera kw1407]EFW99879.1 haloacid dehalogenase type 2 [Grosmannia clavigera kw1407]
MAATIDFEPKFITFDCYGTLTNFSEMGGLARQIFSNRIKGDEMDQFVHLFSGYRFDEVLGPYKSYDKVLYNAIKRTCERTGISFSKEEAESFYKAVPTWGPWPDVPEGLRRLATKYKLAILSNTTNEIIMSNVDKLGAPFQAVFTAQQAQSYKPRMAGFEYMLDKLGCRPEDVLHVSASMEYDIQTADAMGIKHKVFVNRGKAATKADFHYYEVDGIDTLATALGL